MKRSIACMLMVIIACASVKAQVVTPPTWWFGVSGAANFNFYDGTTQRLNNSLIVPAAFHKGKGVRPYGSILAEYRPPGALGAMLNVGYDSRGGKFDGVTAPCDCPATLKTGTSYITVEPSLRLAANNLYFFAGPVFGFNMNKDFAYTQLKQPNTNAELSNMRSTTVSGQVGMGYEIPLSAATNVNKVNLSPFVSFHPYFGRQPRDIESWNVTTVRAGLALKFGKGKKAAIVEPPVVVVPFHDVMFSVRAPKLVPLKRQVSETLPLRNSVFFDEGSAEIPTRYIVLSKGQATDFKEVQLQNEPTGDMNGRSARQLTAYHNILNILGDRLRANPGSSITLTGASANGPVEGKALAATVKQYLVTNFDIAEARITIAGRTKPVIPSEQPGGTKELALLRAGDRRVDITSTSPELLLQVGGEMMRPVQIVTTQTDPLDSHVIFNVDSASQNLKNWTIDVTDEKGIVQHYGPFTGDQASVSGAAILGSNPAGDYKVVMMGDSKTGLPIRKESTVHLVRQDEAPGQGLRYSILFDFDSSNSTASYDKFLTDVVAPSIADGSTVIIHGHTDVIGEEDHNLKLSQDRAREVQKILEAALAKAGKNNVKFVALGFGEDPAREPFENNLVEERFYNRTVIIDIVPVK